LQQRRQDKNIKFIYRLYSYLYDIPQCLPDTEGYSICFERSVPMTCPQKRLLRTGFVRSAVTGANQEWAPDFVHDAAESGRKFRVLRVIDMYTRECLALEVDTSFASRRVTREFEKIVVEREAPEAIRCDNGPEFTSRHFLAWAIERKIELAHIEPGRLTGAEFANPAGKPVTCNVLPAPGVKNACGGHKVERPQLVWISIWDSPAIRRR
jgi:hypothetical protein